MSGLGQHRNSQRRRDFERLDLDGSKKRSVFVDEVIGAIAAETNVENQRCLRGLVMGKRKPWGSVDCAVGEKKLHPRDREREREHF